MPKGTKVEEMYQALRREGKSEKSAARIAQAETGLNLQTGKPSKGRENGMEASGKWYGADQQKAYQEGMKAGRSGKPISSCPYPQAGDTWATAWKDGWKVGSTDRSSAQSYQEPFENGRARAEAELAPKLGRFGNVGGLAYDHGFGDAQRGIPKEKSINWPNYRHTTSQRHYEEGYVAGEKYRKQKEEGASR
jgi:ribosome modulation factor